MLDRRSFFKAAAALGMGIFLSPGRSKSGGADPSINRSDGAAGPFSTLSSDACHQRDPVTSLQEIERCGDLLDDLDCTELVSNYVGLTEFSRAVGDTSFWRAYCPFCKQRTVRSLERGQEGFNCEWCGSTGSAIDCYTWLEGISHSEARQRLEGFLNDGTLVGRRPEYEHAWSLMAGTREFYHEVLIGSPAGAEARRVLLIRESVRPLSNILCWGMRRWDRWIC